MFQSQTALNCNVKRSYSTSQDPSRWPASSSPSPYDIFGIPRKEPDQKKLRRLYLQLAKQYHPDSPSELEVSVKSDRFKKVMSAYEILKDEDKRRSYDIANSSSSHVYTGRRTHAPSGNNTQFYQPQTDDFYSRGPFDGFDEEARARMNDEEFQKDLAENRYRLVTLIAIATGIYGIAQVVRVMKQYEEQGLQAELNSKHIHLDTIRARSNYGLGTGQDERIERFLQSRKESAYYNKHERPHDELLLSSEAGNLTPLDEAASSRHIDMNTSSPSAHH